MRCSPWASKELRWSLDGPQVWAATGPTGAAWRVTRCDDARWGIALDPDREPKWWAESRESALGLVEGYEARHTDPLPQILGCTWEEATGARKGLVAEVEGAVTERYWGRSYAGWDRYEPFWAETNGDRPAKRRRRTAPADKHDADEFGADASGRIRVTRRYGFGEWLRDESLTIEREGVEARLHFYRWIHHAEFVLRAVEVPTYDESGRLVELDTWLAPDCQDGYSWLGMEFTWDDDRLISSQTSRLLASSTAIPPAEIRVTHATPLSMHYDESGELVRINADDYLVYRRAAAGDAAKALRLLCEELPERIAAWAERTAPPGQGLYCLAIHYAEYYNRPLPPSLALGTLTDVQRWGPDAEPEVIFNPAEFAHHDAEPAELTDDVLMDAYATLNTEWSAAGNDAQPRRLLVSVAKALAERDWSTLYTAPAGFVVYAIDLELENLGRDLPLKNRPI